MASIVDSIRDLLTGIPSVAVMTQRLALVNEQLEALAEEHVKLQAENAALVKRTRELDQELAAARQPADFVQYRGVLFKRQPSGEYSKTVYCPTCKTALSCMEDFFEFRCSRCSYDAPLKGGDLTAALRDVAAGARD